MTTPSTQSLPAPVAPRLIRASSGRMVGGVARGIAEHLGVDVWWVRGAFVLLGFIGGSGFLAYAILWALVPIDTHAQQEKGSIAATVDGRGAETSLLLVLGATGVVVGALLLASMAGLSVRGVLPLGIAGLGAALIWLRADEGQRDRLRSGVSRVTPGRRAGVLQFALRVVLILVGLISFGVGGVGLEQAGTLLAAVVVVVVGIALVASPFALRLWRERDAERRARIRSEERAEVAAQVHDSVLQSLTLIQRNAADPAEVARIARAQERDLRRWLYPAPSLPSSSFRAALEEVAAEVEDTYGVRVEVVCVGDAVLNEPLTAMLQATREAVSNAGRHSGVYTVSVYAEMTSAEVMVHVRDRGAGFSLDDVPDDRMGVRESILGRIERYGGRASVTTEPGAGTRVELVMGTR
ncbi:MAG: PspC domain-containing protein [Actinomycetia bacterium]|nr:PspC domain-containing protein [Actinomycetes bacterium]